MVWFNWPSQSLIFSFLDSKLLSTQLQCLKSLINLHVRPCLPTLIFEIRLSWIALNLSVCPNGVLLCCSFLVPGLYCGCLRLLPNHFLYILRMFRLTLCPNHLLYLRCRLIPLQDDIWTTCHSMTTVVPFRFHSIWQPSNSAQSLIVFSQSFIVITVDHFCLFLHRTQ